MPGRRGIAILLLVAVACCGRTGMGKPPIPDGGDAISADGLADLTTGTLPDASPPDLASLDAWAPDATATETSPALLPCQALKPLADQDLLLKARAREVHFAPDRSYVLLRVSGDTGDNDGGANLPDRLVRIELPSGKVTTITDSVYYAEALGPRGALLIHNYPGAAHDLTVYDHPSLRHVATDACQVRPAPDGSRLYLLAKCVDEQYGDLDVIDVATGGASVIARDVVAGSVAIAPSGGWIAFVTRDPSGDAGANVLHLLPTGGQAYAVTSAPGAYVPHFVSDGLLVFVSGQCSVSSDEPCEIRGHRVGSGDTSYVIDSGRDRAFPGYQISPDKRWMLTAGLNDSGSGTLYAVALDATGNRILATDLTNYWAASDPLRPFAFEATGRYVVYLTSAGDVAAADLAAGTTSKVAEYADFVVTPLGSSVLLYEHRVGWMRLRLVDLSSAEDPLSFATQGYILAATALENSRALLFMESMPAGVTRLRYLSASDPAPLVLGEWQQSQLSMNQPPEAEPWWHYPVDPTGCFTIVDTDLPPGPGTRLVLLPE